MSDTLILPPGYKRGLTLPTRPVQEVCKPLSAVIKTIPVEKWPQMIGEISLRPRGPKPPYDQGPVGSCASEGGVGGLHIIRNVAGLPEKRLNPYFVYNDTSGGRDNGSNILDNLASLRTRGVAPQDVWPRSKGWRAEPSAEAKREALKYRIDEFYYIENWEQFGTALLKGFPVVFGYSGHAIVAVELLSTNSLLYLNSWGDWGDDGHGTLRASSIVWPYGAFAVRTAVAA